MSVTPRNRDELPLNRLEAFSDGVFAIAVTILVLELSVEAGAEDHLLDSLLHQWPAYLAFVTSFLTIGYVWLEHSAITHALRAADEVLYRLNLLVLLLASFLPFPTKLVSEFIEHQDAERVAAAFYGLTLLAIDLALMVFVRYAAENRRLVNDELEAETVEDALRRAPSFVLYGVGIVMSLFLPRLAVGLYLATALYLGIPGKTLGRLLRGR